MRRALDKKKLLRKPVGPELDQLDRLISYNKYNERQASKFLIRKRAQILSLIPGKGCKARPSLLKEFNQHFINAIQTMNGTIGKAS